MMVPEGFYPMAGFYRVFAVLQRFTLVCSELGFRYLVQYSPWFIHQGSPLLEHADLALEVR